MNPKRISMAIAGVALAVESIEDVRAVTLALSSFEAEAEAKAAAPLNVKIGSMSTAMREVVWLQDTIDKLEKDAAKIADERVAMQQERAENAGAIAGRDEALRKLATAKDTIAALEEQVKRLAARCSRADKKKGRGR